MAIGPSHGSGYRDEDLRRRAQRESHCASGVEQVCLADLVMVNPLLVIDNPEVKELKVEGNAAMTVEPLACSEKGQPWVDEVSDLYFRVAVIRGNA